MQLKKRLSLPRAEDKEITTPVKYILKHSLFVLISEMSGSSIKFDKLNRSNYDTWRLQMKAMLVKDGLWQYVSGDLPRPTAAAGVPEWDREDQKALADIVLSVSPSELRHIKNTNTSKAAWDKLESVYRTSGPARKVLLLKSIVTNKMKDGDDPKTHIENFSDNVDKLAEIGIEINKDLLCILLLCNLSPAFETFHRAITTRDDIPDFEALKIKIIEDHESRANLNNDQDKDQGALFAKNVKRGKDNRKFTSNPRFTKVDNNYRCYKCNKQGHYAKHCRSNLKMNQEARQVEVGDAKSSKAKSENIEIALFHSKEIKPKIPQQWCLDSGCTSHMVSNRAIFDQFTKVEKPLNLANRDSTKITGIGNVRITLNKGEGMQTFNLQNVYHVPDLRTNLLSVSKITNQGYKVMFDNQEAKVIDDRGKILMKAERRGDLYFVDEREEARLIEADSWNEPKNDIEVWHRRLGHLNEQTLLKMINEEKAHGFDIKRDGKLPQCDVCASEKATRLPFPKTSPNRTSDLLEIIHTDVCGPMRQKSIAGSKYFVTYIDDKSRWCEIDFLKEKSDVLDSFKNYKNRVERQTGRKIKFIQSDNGKEFCNKNFDDFLKKEGIQRRLTTPYTPEQNGIAERQNRTLVEMARCLLKQGNMPPRFWAEAINTAAYVRNRCSTKALNGETPHKIWTGKTPSIRYMRDFGSKVYVLKKKQQSGKFSSKADVGVMIGYSKESKAYRIWLLEEKKIISSRDVKFFNEPGFNDPYEMFQEHTDQPDSKNESNTEKGEDTTVEVDFDKSVKDVNIEKQSKTLHPRIPEEHKRGRGRPRIHKSGLRGRPRRIFSTGNITNNQNDEDDTYLDSRSDICPQVDDSDDEVFSNLIIGEAPETWEEACSRDDAQEWEKALEDEFISLIKNNTWEIREKPDDKRIVDHKLVLQVKFSDNDEIKRKVRLVAKGFNQRFGEDYMETYSPVVKITSIRVLCALAAAYDLEIHQMDVKTAYLNGELQESVYMKIPKNLKEILNKILQGKQIGTSQEMINDEKLLNIARKWASDLEHGDNKVCLLKKALYGLKQSGVEWHKRLVGELKNLGLTPLPQDQCFFFSNKGDKRLLLTIYVDDILIASNDIGWITKIKGALASKFEVKDLGRAKRCLGIEFNQDLKNHEVKLSQPSYINQLLKRFKMENCKMVSTPIETNSYFPPSSVTEESKTLPYQNLIGALLYLAVSTRPDISFAVSYLSQFNTCYNKTHWKAAKRVLRYLKATQNYGIKYRQNSENLYGMADADWGGDKTDRRSFTGIVYNLSGSPIYWECKKQRTVALSSTEAEYMALTEATKEAKYLQGLLQGLGLTYKNTEVLCDSQSAIKLTQSKIFHSRSKHIDVRHHFVREAVEKGIIKLVFTPSEEMPADVLTKGLSKYKHMNCLSNMGMMIA